MPEELPENITQEFYYTDPLLFEWKDFYNIEFDETIDFRTVDSESAMIVKPLKGAESQILPSDFENLAEFTKFMGECEIKF